jgi:hypothetical protein
MRPSVERILRRHWLLVGGAAAAAAISARSHLWGVVVGGAAIGVSTLLYAAVFLAVLRRGSGRLAFGMLSVKFVAFLGLGWLVFAASEAYRPDPVGFVVGVSCMPVAAVWEAMRARKNF